MQQPCRFHLEVYAPQGPVGVEEHLRAFPGEVRSADDGILVASGDVYRPEAEAWELLVSLSDALQRAGFSHMFGMDSPGGRSRWQGYDWPPEPWRQI